jgi:hypothetical protein
MEFWGRSPFFKILSRDDLIFPLEDRVGSTLLLSEFAARQLFKERRVRKTFGWRGGFSAEEPRVNSGCMILNYEFALPLRLGFLYGREFREFWKIQNGVNGSKLARISFLIYCPASQLGSRSS